MSNPNELPPFSDYDRRTFEHAAEDEGYTNPRVTEVDDDEGTCTIESDQGSHKWTADDDGFPTVVE